uniref:hypothetical protein n=1 Tax=uncultured Rhizobium sp. TaxID=155567 RepID=UPI002618C740|nr:hypothetical protein [uncultured Rhizobium sp.]
MKIASKTHLPERSRRPVRNGCDGDRPALGLFLSALQSLLFILLLVQGDWGQTLQRQASHGQALADVEDPRNALANRTETPRALVASADRQRSKVRLGDAPDATPPSEAQVVSNRDGHSPHAAPDPDHLTETKHSAYRARAPPIQIV